MKEFLQKPTREDIEELGEFFDGALMSALDDDKRGTMYPERQIFAYFLKKYEEKEIR